MSRQLIIYCIIFACIVSLGTFFTPHAENDEQVYTTLAQRITCMRPGCFIFDFHRYNLLGTPILQSLPDAEYHASSFFHPPAFIVVLSLFYRVGGGGGIKALPLILYFLIAFIIYRILSLLDCSKKTKELGVVLSLCSSLLLFNSQQIWMDLFMATMTLLSFYFLVAFAKGKNKRDIVLSGIFFFCAVFTKYWAIILIIPFVFFIIQNSRRKSFIPLILFFLPISLVGINYVLKIIPISSHPLMNELFHLGTASKHSPYPFIEYVTHRPLYYYFYAVFLINPVYLYMGMVMRRAFNKTLKGSSLSHHVAQISVCIILYSLVFFSFFGLLQSGFQTRYIVFIEPFFIILASLFVEKSEKKDLPLLFLFLIHNIVLVVINTVIMNSAELFPFIEMLRMF